MTMEACSCGLPLDSKKFQSGVFEGQPECRKLHQHNWSLLIYIRKFKARHDFQVSSGQYVRYSVKVAEVYWYQLVDAM